MAGILHVRGRTPYEAECAEKGGADRLVVVSDDDLSPAPEIMAKVRKASTVHLRVLLRLREGYLTDGGELTRLQGLASAYREAGADGFIFGFLNAMSGIDRRACQELMGDNTWGWTFDRAIDAALDQDRAWRDVETLPRLDSIMTAGSAREVEQGLDRLIESSNDNLIVAGGLRPEHIPWLIRGGLRQFYMEVTPITHESVRSWRRLIDEELDRLPR